MAKLRGSGEKPPRRPCAFAWPPKASQQARGRERAHATTPTTPELAQLTDSSPAYGQFMPLPCCSSQ